MLDFKIKKSLLIVCIKTIQTLHFHLIHQKTFLLSILYILIILNILGAMGPKPDSNLKKLSKIQNVSSQSYAISL